MKTKFSTIINFPITRIIIGAATCITVFIGMQNFILRPFFVAIIPSEDLAKTFANYLGAIILLLTYYFVFKSYDKRKITELSLRYLPKELFIGLVLGFLSISLVILMLHLLGYYSILSISNSGYFLKPLSMLVGAALIEEIFFRGILYRILENWQGTFIALFVMGFLFELPHTFNENSTFLSFLLGVIFGVTHGLMYTYTKRIWLPFAFHLGWNLAQPFYGSNLSGLEDLGTVIKAKFEGPALLIGTNYGVEDSLISLGLLTLIGLSFLYASIRNKKIIKWNYTSEK